MSVHHSQQASPYTGLSINRQAVRLDRDDNLLIARVDIVGATALQGETVITRESIAAGQKVAARDISAGEHVIKGGRLIGVAVSDIAAGSRILNTEFKLDDQTRDPLPTANAAVLLPADQRATFQGYVRADGRVATRNYLGVFIVGNCAATAARKVADWFTEARLAAWPNVDGVIPFIHEIGCGMEMTGEPMDLLRRTMSGSIRNPNIAGALVLALGCERNNIYGFLDQEKLSAAADFQTLVLQEVGGTANAIEQGIAAIEKMLPAANTFSRQTVSAEHLSIGIQSAALDGFCAVSANPSLGAAMDRVVQNGGTVILSDTGDLAALGEDLRSRAADADVAEQLRLTLQEWRTYQQGRDTRLNRQIFTDKEAKGLSTIREKALTGLSRGGSTPIQGVFGYAHKVTRKGLVFMDAPSYEAVSATGQVAGGANMICLTTGGGSGFGAALAPTLKMASTTKVFRHLKDDLDLDCGPVLDGQFSVQQMGQRIFDSLLRHASGEKTCSEALGVGENEFVPWPKGVLA
ncbi:altronate dehydratase [Pseudomonas sp. GM102]|uniref:altronate dehydratase family protein n=1 Tax=Pseudomonas sp. GM102 TaxID=1144321 RepID=UPI00026F54AA|nr:altronate dehydratase family protein [Pseudomonas sp. GM102]EJM03040.1 altronate dehydratase [Pseudomonas sp. GM102]